MPHNIEGIQQFTAEEVKKIIEDPKDIVILDVREPEEYNAGHIPGVPLVPMHTIPSKLNELDKDKEYLFICRSGNRSHQVARFLKQNGFEKVNNFNGGMLSWTEPVKTGMEE
ncbi:rhodanese-like domain-containing protein [Tumebacillus flagellatus]|uniref:Sulfurtransferase n=1 Tax=Tumebacillus flagellatus TaxID=1157490 RepID=A0A074LUY7_9BACL|nr:rhodanese-like domain-containing protein [Tumebacillus flagellatus]KEO84440.1 sulfurtransferase [Tumebacillus flagellatus]